jgi:hypothetical protein
MDDGPTWPGRLAEALAEGLPGPVVAERLDVLLRWMADPQADEARPLARAIEARGLAPGAAREAAFALLEHVLFGAGSDEPHRVLGLRAGTDARTVQARYHRLVQLYHPDRNQGEREWLTERTERLNRAYSQLKRQGPDAAAVPGPRPAAAARPPAPDYPRAAYPRESVNIRRHLGSARQARRRIFLGLAAASMALLGYLYLVNAPYRAPGPENGAATQAPQPVEAGGTVVASAEPSAEGPGRDDAGAAPAADAVPAPRDAEADAEPQAGSAPPPPSAEDPSAAPADAARSGIAAPAGPTADTPSDDLPRVAGGEADSPSSAIAEVISRPPETARAPAQQAAPAPPAEPAAGAAGRVLATGPVEKPVAAPPERAASSSSPPTGAGPDAGAPAQIDTGAEPEARPQPPAPAAAPAPVPAPPVLTPEVRRQAEQAVDRYAAAFERGDARSFAGLLAERVRIDGGERTAADVASGLAGRLEGAVVRTMEVASTQVTALSGGAARATAVYAQRVLYADGRGGSARGTLVLGLEPSPGGLRIASVDHRNVDRRDDGAADDVRGLLDRYCEYYAAGRLQDFVDLFTADGVDNKVRGRIGLLDEYRTLFDSTRARSLSIEVGRIETSDGKRFHVDGSYTVGLEYLNGRKFEATAAIRIVVVDGRGGMRIEGVEY